MKDWLKKTGIWVENTSDVKNRFGLNEFSGAVGDLGTFLPLTFALIVFNGFSAGIVFLTFGIIYALTGWFYKVPVSVQPLKAMSVIAIAYGFSPEFLAVTSFFYGILFVFLSLSGLIRWLQKVFTPTLVRGVQFGIGLILAKKSVELVVKEGFLLHHQQFNPMLNIGLLITLVIVIWAFQMRKKWPVGLILVGISAVGLYLLGWGEGTREMIGPRIVNFTLPDVSMLKDALLLLMIPQLPLTLGNAVYAAADSCHSLWGKQAKRVTPGRLALSIGLSDMAIGLLGGFPICHGAGGMGAHAQFGAKTGGATIILGTFLILVAIIAPLQQFIFLIPVPLLAAMLLFDSYRMMTLVQKLPEKIPMGISVVIGLISLLTRNLTIALIVGFALEKIYLSIQTRTQLAEGVGND